MDSNHIAWPKSSSELALEEYLQYCQIISCQHNFFRAKNPNHFPGVFCFYVVAQQPHLEEKYLSWE